MTGKNQRFHLLYKNVVASFFIKGYAALIALMLVPLTIDCLGTLKNGQQRSGMDKSDGHRLGERLTKQIGYPCGTPRDGGCKKSCQLNTCHADMHRDPHSLLIDSTHVKH